MLLTSLPLELPPSKHSATTAARRGMDSPLFQRAKESEKRFKNYGSRQQIASTTLQF